MKYGQTCTWHMGPVQTKKWKNNQLRSLHHPFINRELTQGGGRGFLNASKFVLPSVFSLIDTICPKIWAKAKLRMQKSPLPVDVAP